MQIKDDRDTGRLCPVEKLIDMFETTGNADCGSMRSTRARSKPKWRSEVSMGTSVIEIGKDRKSVV